MRLDDFDHIARSQHGLITLAGSGLSRSAWYRAIASGTIRQLHPGVSRLVGTPTTYRQRVAAAVLAMAAQDSGAGRPLASHRSAAALHIGMLVGVDDETHPVDVLAPGRSGARSVTGVVVHRPTDRARLTPARVDRIPCTNILRTLVDLGAVDRDAVDTLLGHALSTRQVTLAAVEAALLAHGRPGRSGVVALRRALDRWAIDAKPADSVLEIAFGRLVARHRLPRVEFHPVVEGWEVDFRFVGTRLVVECDGWASHGLDRTQFERDRRRDADLAAAGWLVSRHSYRSITSDAARTAAVLRRLLAIACRP